MENLCRKLCRFLDPFPWALTTPEGFPSPPSKEGRSLTIYKERGRGAKVMSLHPFHFRSKQQTNQGEERTNLSFPPPPLSTGHFPGERGGIRLFKTIFKRQISSGNGRQFFFFFSKINNVDFCATAGKSTLRVELYEDASWQGMKLASPSLPPLLFPFLSLDGLKEKGTMKVTAFPFSLPWSFNSKPAETTEFKRVFFFGK